MESLLASKRHEISEVCRQFHVRRLEVFGSASRGDFDPSRSDVDFLVEFDPDSPIRALDAYFGLREALEAVLGRPVDLLMPAAVRNPYLRESIERNRETLYAALSQPQ